MSYLKWFQEHERKHHLLIHKLLSNALNNDEIVEYFLFENMVTSEPDFCPLYKTQTKCHDIKELNCYLCACPNFRFTDIAKKIDNKNIYSYCSINSLEGKVFEDANNIHQDCSKCSIPHKESYVKKKFDISWGTIMKKCKE